MTEDHYESLANTFRFFRSLACSSSDLQQDPSVWQDTLMEQLRLDGYQLQPLESISHRSLQEGEVSGTSFYIDLVLIFICVLCAGLASGLTQGLLSLDFLEMTIKSQSGTPKEKEYATRVIPIIKHHHLLLVTLMLWNASATEALPLFLNSLVPEYVAIIISVTLVLMFGEIIPASILTGPRQLEIVSMLTPIVYIVYVLFFPVAYPISKLLDFVIGHEEGLTLYSRREIITMMRMQHEEGTRRNASTGVTNRDTVHNDEMLIIDGALTFRDMKVSEVMTPVEKAFMISTHENLSYKTLYEIFKAGYSRIPVYENDPNDIVGLLLAKDLIFVDPEDETPISNFVEFFGRHPVIVWHDQLLGEVLATFRRERAHLAIVRDVVSEGDGDPYYKVVGLITLEDIIEEIIGAEIEDEFDVNDEESITGGGGAGGTGSSNRIDRRLRDLNLARLKALRSKITDDTLSTDEIQAIAQFLPNNVPQVQTYIDKYHLSLPEVIQKSYVFVLKKQTKEGALTPHPSDIIVKKGKFMNTCILILQGRVRVVEEIESKEEEQNTDDVTTNSIHMTLKTTASETILGPWSTLCADALISPDGSYIPNFSAYIHSNDLRFVRLATVFNTDSSGVDHYQHHHHPHHHHGGTLLLRSGTAQSSGGEFRSRQELSGVDALSTNSNSNQDRQAILLASFHENQRPKAVSSSAALPRPPHTQTTNRSSSGNDSLRAPLIESSQERKDSREGEVVSKLHEAKK